MANESYFISKGLLSTFQLLMTITFIYGLTPFRIVDSKTVANTTVLKPCRIGYVNACILMTIYITCYIISAKNCESFVGYFFRSKISRIGDVLQTITGLVGIILIYISAWMQKEKLAKMLTQICATNERLHDLGIDIFYKRIARFFYLIMFSLHAVNVTYIVGCFFLARSFMQRNPSVQVMIGFILQYLIISTVIGCFLCTLRIIGRRFMLINQILKNLSMKFITIRSADKASALAEKPTLKCLKSFSMIRIIAKPNKDIIQEAMETHQLLCESAGIANSYFTYQLFIIISISFLIIVFDAYYVLETGLGEAKKDANFRPVEFVTFFLCQMILYIVAIICIVEASIKTSNKSEKTSGIVHILLNNTVDPEEKEKLQHFSMQLIHQKVRFTAAGLFTIDRTLYFTISGAITTYLIILLQFSVSSSGRSHSSSSNTTTMS